MNAVDTNVLVYSLDVHEPAKQAKAKALLAALIGAQPGTVLLWQVASELLSVLRNWERQGRVSTTNVEANFRDIFAMFPLSLPGPQVFTRYFDLFARFSLSHWDAMLLAACKEAGVATLYSEDMDAGTDYDGLKIVNPFA
ncbi:MAG TPA: PIN domain-containing protein [Gemmataceae bacterium]|nr:PIN domain-containing protein [Gemmataceae bacterium]